MNYSANRPLYIWQRTEWPLFRWDERVVTPLFNSVQNSQSRLLGMLSAVGFEVRQQTSLESMCEDVVRSSEIEGEILNRDSVRSSIARHLGVTLPQKGMTDHYTDGVVQVQMDAVMNAAQPLTKERLCNWHAALFPTGRSGMYPITVADWRKGEEPMLIVSGPMGKEQVHYEAPPSSVVPEEMPPLLKWVNENNLPEMLKAAVAHLWFVVIHPFDDGNGRLARTITDMLMARQCGAQWLYYSVSAEILQRRKSYYEVLQKASCGELDITEWIVWFLQCVQAAIAASQERLDGVLAKTEFWQHHTDIEFNERQRKVLNRLFDGFDGPLTSSKWAKICHCSPDTALRDINDLITKGIMVKADSGGRSTHYVMAR